MKIKIPKEASFLVEGSKIMASKGDKKVNRTFPSNILNIKTEGNTVEIISLISNAKARALIGTFRGHIKNMINGLEKPFSYELKVCSSHFPISVKQSGDELQIQNFIGERKPRKIKVPKGVNVEIKDGKITVSSPNKELAGMCASRIEQGTRLTNKDRRIFQDGIYITKKPGGSV